jgi:hypothetical protein
MLVHALLRIEDTIAARRAGSVAFDLARTAAQACSSNMLLPRSRRWLGRRIRGGSHCEEL